MMRDRDHLDIAGNHAIDETKRKFSEHVTANVPPNAWPTMRRLAHAGDGCVQFV